MCRWAGLSSEEIYRAVVKARSLPPQYASVVGVGIPRELWKMIGECLQFKASKRPTFHAMLGIFLRHLQGIPRSPPASPEKWIHISYITCMIFVCSFWSCLMSLDSFTDFTGLIARVEKNPEIFYFLEKYNRSHYKWNPFTCISLSYFSFEIFSNILAFCQQYSCRFWCSFLLEM